MPVGMADHAHGVSGVAASIALGVSVVLVTISEVAQDAGICCRLLGSQNHQYPCSWSMDIDGSVTPIIYNIYQHPDHYNSSRQIQHPTTHAV